MWLPAGKCRDLGSAARLVLSKALELRPTGRFLPGIHWDPVPSAVAMPPPVRSRSNASRPEIGEELLGGWLSGKQSSKVMIAGLVGRVLAAGMRQLARTRIDRWAEGDLANLRTVGLPRLAGILIRQPDQQLGPNRRLADRHVT